jgi:hypothetical protein
VIIPTLPVEIYRKVGFDLHGQPKFVRQCDQKAAPVRLVFNNQHTTVRTDSSGSRGHATETTADVVLLLLPHVDVRLDDQIQLLGYKLKVTQVHPRYTVRGKHDHTQIHCDIWV